MQINLNELGFLPASCPGVFYRVEDWDNGYRVADFSEKAEAEAFAAKHAKENGYRYAHKVCTMHLTGRR